MHPAINRSLWLSIMASSLLAGSLLAGCRAAVQPPAASPNLLPAEGSIPTAALVAVDPLPTATPQAEQAAQFLPALENQFASSPTPATTPAAQTPSATPPSSRREIKAGLEASDPSAAQLASGGIQLIEFFAFW